MTFVSLSARTAITAVFAFCASNALAITGCSTAADPRGTAESADLAGAATLVQRSDGYFDVVCRDGTREVDSISQIVDNDVCTRGSSGSTTCVAHCASRYPSGTCSQYEADFCGDAPVSCAANCTSRYPSGTCSGYGADVCDHGSIQCVAHCTARYPSGTCSTYGADTCDTETVTCVPHCSARYPSGTCSEYTEDYCDRGTPQCTMNCVARYPSGTCSQYGADLCN